MTRDGPLRQPASPKLQRGESVRPASRIKFGALALLVACHLSLATALRAQVRISSAFPVVKTYRASFSVACGGAGDCATIYGFANGAARVWKVSALQASTTVNVSFILRSTADSGGTSSSQAPSSGTDANDPAPSAAVKAYTAAPAAGTTAATVSGPFSLVSTGTLVEQFGQNQDKPIVLNSAAQGLAVNVSGAATITVMLEWTE